MGMRHCKQLRAHLTRFLNRVTHMANDDDSSDIEIENESEDWTPGRGLLRGFLVTLPVAFALAVLQGVAAYYFPQLVLHGLLNAFGAFFLTWILFATMHRASGQVGSSVTLLVVLLAVLVIASKHVVLAQHGMFTTRGQFLDGSSWLHPLVIGFLNLFGWLGVGAATLMCRKGDSNFTDIVDILKSNPLWR